MTQASDFQSRFDDFIYRYEWAREFAIDGLDAAVRGELIDHLGLLLEIDINRRGAGAQALMRSWMVFRMARQLGKEAHLQALVREAASDEAAEIFDIFRAGRLGAFLIRRVKSEWELTMLTGAPGEQPQRVEVVTDESFEDFNRTSRVVIGWLLDLDGHPPTSPHAQNRVLIEGFRLADSSAIKLKSALPRAPWGRLDAFRVEDYEADIMALLLDTKAQDTHRSARRIFFRHKDEWWQRSCRTILRAQLPYHMMVVGFPTLRGEAHSDAHGWCAPRADLSNLTPGRLTDLRRDLDVLRVGALTEYYGVQVAGPLAAELCFPDTEFMASLGIQPDGQLILAKNALVGWLDYRIAVLPLDPQWMRRVGIDAGWSIQQGIRWADQNLKVDDRARLQAGVDHHMRVRRWQTLLGAPNVDFDFRALLAPLTYDEIIQGLLRLLPGERTRPVAALAHPLGRTWSGLLKRLKIGDNPTRITLEDLPRSTHALDSRPGFGRKSFEILTDALLEFCTSWPASAGHMAATRGDARVSQSISDGLNELDDLF